MGTPAPPSGETQVYRPVDPGCASISAPSRVPGREEEWFCSSVTGGTAWQRLDLPILDEFLVVLFLHFSGDLRIIVPLPVQVGNLVGWPHARGGIAMAIEAEGHAERFGVINLIHLVDRAVALDATDAAIHVDRVVEKDIVRHLMDLDPGYRFARRRAFPDQFQPGTVLEHLVMAVHAGRSGRHVRIPRFLHRAVAVATIQAELVGVNRMG